MMEDVEILLRIDRGRCEVLDKFKQQIGCLFQQPNGAWFIAVDWRLNHLNTANEPHGPITIDQCVDRIKLWIRQINDKDNNNG